MPHQDRSQVVDLNPYDQPLSHESPGQRYERLASEGATLARLVGLNLTPRGREALAVLIGETEAWWHVSGHSLDMTGLLAMLSKLSKFKNLT